ncbi:uncharacterized protein G2W53_008115 [Senna tora]|uniref:Uncharacterized protein n=1 Tax=Senna tora TaxID=362788 RepID=A0A834X6H5_9FABA|nr:uncharacterized protein G2W53_008115 [Senna tora]
MSAGEKGLAHGIEIPKENNGESAQFVVRESELGMSASHIGLTGQNPQFAFPNDELGAVSVDPKVN